MNKIKSILVDDESHGRVVMKELLAKFCPEVEVIGEAESAQDGHALILEKKPELVFLDIQMPGGTGFEMLKKFNKIDFDVIFVTSYDHYAITAIKFSAVDYLLKPVEIADLKNSIRKVVANREKKESTSGWVINLLNNLEESTTEKKFAVHHKDKVKLLNLSDVVCLEAESNYTTVFTSDNAKYTPARTLKDFEDFLAPHKNFIRINKSVIVNLDHVTGYSKGEPCMIYLKNGKEYEISRRKKAEMNERMK